MILLEISAELADNLNQGLVITLVGYTIVFSALVLLFFVFSNLSKVLSFNLKKKLKKEGKECSDGELSVSNEVNAAISAAIFMYFNEMHDEESNILTIKKVSRNYSPWSSKIYGMRNTNRS